MVAGLVIAGTHSGVGKTTVSLGLMRLLKAAPFKVGPDFIDPSYQAKATGKVARNLDAVLCGEDGVRDIFAHGTRGEEVAIIEGVMGLYDGRIGGAGLAEGSTAHVAKILGLPVVLVVDARKIGQSLAALMRGYIMDCPAPIAGVIINFVGGARHQEICRQAAETVGVELLGMIPREELVNLPSRHLGLVTAGENDQTEEVLEQIASLVARHVDLGAIRAAMREPANAWEGGVSRGESTGKKVAIAAGPAFSFLYPETPEMLGEECIYFDPLVDDVPAADGLIIPGGFPEVYAAELSAAPATRQVRELASEGMPIWAECGGLLWLSNSIDKEPMVRAINATSKMHGLTLGYREAVALKDSLIAEAGQRIMAHEFHHSTIEYACPEFAWGMREGMEGYAQGSIYASYLHIHPVGVPGIIRQFKANLG
ncbi:MAG: cobyrinate a,c-diamide synthase [Corynebacterium sp.]|nr:cobyrinate a,c-diamide synthase [Corynebacterium sp.]